MAKKSAPMTPKGGKDHWEIRHNITKPGEEKNQSYRNWDAMESKKRPCTHSKINELDH